MSKSFPGFESPAVGFEQPFEMLVACHGRVHRTLELLQRLVAHIDAKGHDASSRSATADVLRYFDIAAPLHHEDEELHVFPVLVHSGDGALREAVARLLEDHERMNTLWTQLRGALVRWRDEPAPPRIDATTRTLISEFISCYDRHIVLEEQRIYPAARALLDDAALARIGAEMQARRRTG